MISDIAFAALCDLFRLVDALARFGEAIAIYCAQFVAPRGAG